MCCPGLLAPFATAPAQATEGATLSAGVETKAAHQAAGKDLSGLFRKKWKGSNADDRDAEAFRAVISNGDETLVLGGTYNSSEEAEEAADEWADRQNGFQSDPNCNKPPMYLEC